MPLVKALSMSCMFMPATMAKVAEVAISAKNGWIFSLTVKRTNTRTANTRPRITDTVEPIKQTSSYLTTLTRYSFQTSSGTRRPPVAQQIWVAFFITSAVRPCFAR